MTLTLLRPAEPDTVSVGRKAPSDDRLAADALRTSPWAWTIAGCTCSARRTASWSVTSGGAAAGCCAASCTTRSPMPTMLLLTSIRAILLLTLMLLFLDQSQVPLALPGGQLRADLGADHRADRIKARMHLTPQRFHLGPMPRQDGAHGVLLEAREVQLVVQVPDHAFGATAVAAMRVAPSGDAPPGRAARHEHGSEQDGGPRLRPVEHHDGDSPLAAATDERGEHDAGIGGTGSGD